MLPPMRRKINVRLQEEVHAVEFDGSKIEVKF
jgi:hypothetical protein